MTEELGIAESLADFLEDNNITADDTIIRISELPFDYDMVLSIIYSPSPIPNTAIDVYRQTIDFWVRFANPKAGYNKLVQVLDLLHKNSNYKIDNFHVYFSLAQGMINDMGKDEERRQLYKVSVDFMYRKDLSIS
ncbi:MAG: minor capsid protein [Candidatus Dojkabacteria bacterium]